MTSLLHDWADAPGDEFVVSQALGAGAAAGGGFQSQDEDLAAYLLHASFAVGNRTRVDVHVIGHPPVGITVGGNLDDGDGRKPDGAATPGGEGDQVTPAQIGRASCRER